MKTRLDIRLAELGLAPSREKAKAYIMEGIVYVNGVKADKAGNEVAPADDIEVRGGSEFVSRGGYKLKKATQVFPIGLEGKVCMDVGASTGGFTDCMLQRGAEKVYCVDVGYGQLAWKLRTDPRVVNLERMNARYITREQVPDEIDFASVDVSFISLRLVLPAIKPLLSENGECVCLVKPQFEAGRDKVGKKGVVRDPAVHREVIENCLGYALDCGFTPAGLDYSPVRGPEGNIEYLMYLRNYPDDGGFSPDVGEVVARSHGELDR